MNFVTVSILSMIAMTTLVYAQQLHELSNSSSFTKRAGTYVSGTTSSGTPNVVKFLTYQNSTYGIKILYPFDWVYEGSNSSILQNNSTQTVVLFVPPKSGDQDIYSS